MGSLTVPPEGPVYLDASGFIYSVDRIPPYSDLLEPMWQQAQAGQFSIVSSELVILETLVKPLREGDTVFEALFHSLFDAKEVRLIPTTRLLWEEADRLRARMGLKTPGAFTLRRPCTQSIRYLLPTTTTFGQSGVLPSLSCMTCSRSRM